MIDYRRVLIAVDASDEADQVLRAATALDPRGSGRFDVVTVVAPLTSGISSMGGAAYSPSWSAGDLESSIAREVQDNVRERAARFGIAPERVTVLRGRPATEIHAHAEAMGADLIVVGSHGRRGLPRLVLGSTSSSVLHGAPCDVLTIRIGD